MKTNVIYRDDNLKRLASFPEESVDLIYLDPPFFSHKKYEIIWGDEGEVRSFKDRWEGGVEVYVAWMRERAIEMHRILKDTGSIYLHCDWHAGHYLKVMMDGVFGQSNFRNEVIWYYGGKNRRNIYNFGYNHNMLLFYAKTGKHKLVDVTTPWTRNDYLKIRKQKIYTDEDGREYVPTGVYGKSSPHRKTYLDEVLKLGRPLPSVWDIPQLTSSAKERQGYPTQKPEALLERIIKASSREGDVVLDPFCGCGTALVVADRLRRKWIGIDISPTACSVIKNRLQAAGISNVSTVNMPTTVEDMRNLDPFEFQNRVIIEGFHGSITHRKTGDMGIDGRDYLTHNPIQTKQSDKIGRNVVDNFQTAVERDKKDKGYIVAFSFTRGAYEEAARCKREKGLDIVLLTIEKLLEGMKSSGPLRGY